MNTQEIHGRHFATGKPIYLRWDDEHIVGCGPIDQLPPGQAERWLAPALIDLQVNGYAGVDFQRDGVTAADLLTAARGLARDGCTRWLLTLITDDWPRLIARLRHLRQLREGSPELRHAIVGWHIEGPFLSGEPGFRGAHDPTVMIDPTERHVAELRAAAGHDLVLLTLAPERNGALEAIRAAVAVGITVSLGHTDASADVLSEAVNAGAKSFTHLGNGCPRTLDRHDNILWRILDPPGMNRLVIGLIPDAIHLSAPLFRLIHQCVSPDRLYYVSDAMSAAGAPPGRYPLGRLDLEVGADQIVRLPGQSNFAGSALRPIDGILRAAAMLGRSWDFVWRHYSDAPARLMGLATGFSPGAPADFCGIEIDPHGNLGNLTTWVRGQLGTK